MIANRLPYAGSSRVAVCGMLLIAGGCARAGAGDTRLASAEADTQASMQPEPRMSPKAPESASITRHAAASGVDVAASTAQTSPGSPAGTPTIPQILNGCASTGRIAATLLPPNILFLIDRSGSMNCNLPNVTSTQACERTAMRQDAEQPSKWEVVKSALESTIGQLPAGASVGITYFSNDDACGVQSQPNVQIAPLDPPQVKSLFASLDAVQPRGGTPIIGALILAYKRFNPDQTPHQPFGKKIVVLLTDGQEGCAADQTERLLQTEMPNAITARITTFVIGVPGSEVNRGFLSRMAFLGGAPSHPDCEHTSSDPMIGDCHFDMTTQPDLARALDTALAAISGRALQCEFDVPQPATGGKLDYDSVNVAYEATPGAVEELIAEDVSHGCDDGANGWQYTGDKSKIVLCGTACDAVRRAAAIRIVLGCQSWVLR